MKTPLEIQKEMQLTDRVLELVEAQARNDESSLTHGDLQGCIQAIIMDAIEYGKRVVRIAKP